MEGQNIIVCPQCGSNKVQVMPVKMALFASAGCLMWIPIIGWIAAPFVFLAWLISLFIRGKKSMKCNECKHGFTVKTETYKKYKNYLLKGNMQ